ncbi:rod shape-determining protein MreD [Algoriphagus halophytocola]|uniref:Rod shape-determining protein MreD n=1 Tax=Algoriphagus halophytocola TaxID=2991499 RepID=A0ABY6MDN3_9BACT|nr:MULTISPECIES: rod shape-determining protein MreD [unclassified Algoriphagus]UZD21875.1 rod shape-determining protein MreD [Algoriphagus sp. TR-M5]WBL43125.1 rod shape-determining protein MreD [Algoriphagus sp. TR-M9]
MNFRNLISYIFIILCLVIIQVLLLKNLALFGVAFCFIYLLGILSLPIGIQSFPLILVSFLLGLGVDVFYDTLGLHAAAATFLGFLRPHWLKAISPTGGYDDSSKPTMTEMGIGWYLSYSFPLVFAFSLVFFIADQWGTGGLFGVLNKSFFSSIFTVILAIIVQLLFFKRRRGI